MASKRPTAEQMDERIKLDLPADEAIEAIMKTGPHPDDDKPKKPRKLSPHDR